jgi:hypothetical protein
MSIWLLAGWGTKWLRPSEEAVDNVINAIIPYDFEGLRKNARSPREVPAVQHESY